MNARTMRRTARERSASVVKGSKKRKMNTNGTRSQVHAKAANAKAANSKAANSKVVSAKAANANAANAIALDETLDLRMHLQTTTGPITRDPNEVYALEEPFVFYRPENYSIVLEYGHEPHRMCYVRFGRPMNIFQDIDVPGFDGEKLAREFLTEGLPFYVSQATSTTSVIQALKGTSFPSWGISPDGSIAKTTSLVTLRKYTLSWLPLFEQHERMKKATSRYSKVPFEPYIRGTEYTQEKLLTELAARTSSWTFLRISAKIGGGIWDVEPRFREFVLTHPMTLREGFTQLNPAEDTLLNGMRKSPLFDTTQINRFDQPVGAALLACRLDLRYFTPKVEMIDREIGGVQVTFPVTRVRCNIPHQPVDGLVRLDRLGSAQLSKE